MDKFDLSLAQRCEAAEYKRIALETLTEDERLHVLANSGKDHHWLRVAPLHWRNFRLNPRVFVTLKRRLRLPVYTHAFEPGGCSHCVTGARDIDGDHALLCSGSNGAQANTRHNAIARLIAEAARQAGFSVEIEHSGGLRGPRAGDVFIRDFDGGQHMLVDVQVCDPLCTSYKHKLAKPGAVATWRQQFKISKYKRGLKACDDKYQFCLD